MTDAAHRRELVGEALTMALYVAIVLLAVLAGVGPHLIEVQDELPRLLPGTGIGLVLAHVFAFSLSHVAVTQSPGSIVHRGERLQSIGAMLLGAGVVLVVAELPLLLVDDIERAALWSELLLAGVIGGTAWSAARSAGSSRRRAATYTAFIVLVAAAVVSIKTALGGH